MLEAELFAVHLRVIGVQHSRDAFSQVARQHGINCKHACKSQQANAWAIAYARDRACREL